MEYQLALYQALGIATGGIFSPGSILIMLILYGSKNAPKSAITCLLGYLTGYTLIGNSFVYLRQTLPASLGSGYGSTFYFFFGVLLLIIALRIAVKNKKISSKKGLFSKIDSMSPLKTFGLGLMVTILNFKNLALFLSSVSLMNYTEMSFSKSLMTIVFIVLTFCSALFVPPAIYFLFPKKSKELLGEIRIKIEKNQQKIVLTVLPVFALFFLLKGYFQF